MIKKPRASFFSPLFLGEEIIFHWKTFVFIVLLFVGYSLSLNVYVIIQKRRKHVLSEKKREKSNGNNADETSFNRRFSSV